MKLSKQHLLVGLGLIGIVALASTVTVAATRNSPWANVIYNIPRSGGSETVVSVFDDDGNKCYVVKGPYRDGGVSISCVRETAQ